MGTIISFSNYKGGVAKTTTTASVGSILSSMGKKVLVVDVDAQANLTASLYKEEVDVSVFHAMNGDAELPIINISENLDLVPASLQLAMADITFASAMCRERLLANLIEPIKNEYDYILIDCPPSLGLLTLNAFTLSDEIIAPLTAEVLPVKGLKMILDFIDKVKKHLNPTLHFAGILITKWENTTMSKKMESELRSIPSIFTFDTKIRKNVSVAEAPLEAKDIVNYAPKSHGAQDYKAFTKELLCLLE